MRKICVIHPSRQRVHKAFSSYTQWKNTAKMPFDYVLSIDTDDPQKANYENLFKDVLILENQNRGCIDAVNTAVKHQIKFSDCDIFIVLSEDFDNMPVGWDSIILDAVQDKKDFVLKTFDGQEKWIVTLPIFDKDFFCRFGYIYNPIYAHLFCDTELTTVAEMLNVLIVRNDILFRQTRGNDDLNKKNNNTWFQGEKIYIERYKKNFDLDILKYPFRCCDIPHFNWIQKTLIKYR